MSARRIAATIVFVFVLPVGSAAARATGEGTAERFRLVSAGDGLRLEQRLNAAAEDGFRLLDAAEGLSVDGRPRFVALMERSGTGYEYRTLTCSGTLENEDTRKALSDLGSQGFRLSRRSVLARKLEEVWLPDTAYEAQMLLILERDADRRPRVYDALSFGEYEPFYRDLAERRGLGFRVVGMWNSNRALQLILEKTADAPQRDDVPDHRLLLIATRTGLRAKLESASGAGYRIMAAEDPSVTGPPILLLERIADPGDAVDYKFVDDLPERLRKDDLETRLNKRGDNGFRAIREAMTDEVILMQAPARSRERTFKARYRTLSSRRAPGLPAALEEALAQGWEFVQLFVEPDETTALVEKIESADPR